MTGAVPTSSPMSPVDLMRKCSKRGCDQPAGRGFRFCGVHLIRRRSGKDPRASEEE